MKKLTHPADGLYWFSASRARTLNACSGHLEMWLERHGEAEVPITLNDMAKQENMADPRRVGSPALWCLEKMYRWRLITADEFQEAQANWSERYDKGAASRASALMDALLARAKREGSIP